MPTYDLTQAQKATGEEKYQLYGALDTTGTLEIFNILRPRLSEAQERTYRWSLAQQSPALAMSMRGVRIDTVRRSKVVSEIKADLTKLQAQIAGHPLVTANWVKTKLQTGTCLKAPLSSKLAKHKWPRAKKGQPALDPTTMRCEQCGAARTISAPFEPTSPIQTAELFYERIKVPKQTGKTGGLTTDDEALDKIARLGISEVREAGKVRRAKVPGLAEFCGLLREFRDLSKQLDFLSAKLTPDGRYASSFNVAAPWCLTGDHEVLTASGWQRLDAWDGVDHIMVGDGAELWLDEAQKVEFAGPHSLTKINAPRMSLEATAEHRIPWRDVNAGGQLRVSLAGERKHLFRALSGGFFKGNSEAELHTRLAVMVQADGHISWNQIKFHFRKRRKIARCRELLAAAGLEFSEVRYKDRTTRITLKDAPKWLQEAKVFGPWLLKHSPTVFWDELPKWDGHKTSYTSSVLGNVEWAVTMAHLAGLSARVRVSKPGVWRTQLCQDAGFAVPKSAYSTVIHAGPVYCAQTKPGFFLVRHAGVICLTGNTGRWSSSKNPFGEGGNLQNVGEKHRSIFLADPGHRLFYSDLKTAESLHVAYLSGDPGYIEAHNGDVHTWVCREIWPDLPWTGDIKKDKAIAQSNYPEWDKAPGHDLRFQSKRIQHGSNYGLSPHGLAMIAHIPRKAAEMAQEKYFTSFPEIKNWQNYIQSRVKDQLPLSNALRRTVILMGRPWDGHTFKQGLSFPPQSGIGDVLNLGLWRLWHRADPELVYLLAQIHDAVLGQYRIEREAEAQEAIMQALRIPVPIEDFRGVTRMCTIQAELAVGGNWGKRGPDNPDGIEEVKL